MGNQNQNEKPKKSLWGKLSSLVLEEDNSANESAEASNTGNNNASNSSPSKFSYSDASQNNANTNFAVGVPANGVFDQKFYNDFIKIIEDNNIEGVDYCEFSKAKKANDNIPGMAEPLKFQSAFHTLKANYPQLTKERLLETADFYVGKLNDEEIHFTTEMQNEINAQVNSRLDQAKAKQDEIAKKQEEIAKLQAEMGTLQAEIG